MFEKFVTDRLTEGKLSEWDKLPKRKLKTFKSANVTALVRSGEKLVKVKEERGSRGSLPSVGAGQSLI